MVGAAVALTLLSGLLHPGAASDGRRDLQAQHFHINGWRLNVSRDRFVGAATCTIEKSNIVYRHGVVTFSFGHKINTANAIFRLDNGPAQTAGSVAVKAAGLGASFSGPSLVNPSNGEVHIPADDLTQTSRIAIQPNSKTQHRTFDLTGLSHVIEAAKAKNCDII